MRSIRRILLTILIFLAAYWLFRKLDVIPSLKDIFSSKPVVIDETPILVKEIKSIGQLITYSFSDEVVADSVIVTKASALVNTFNRLAPIPILPSADKQLVLIGKGKVLAGANLQLLADSSVTIKNDTVRVYMPQTQIIDVILNPSDFETFIEKGEWKDNEVLLVKAKARRKITEHALQQKILDKADAKAKAIMENFLRNMGYKNVFID